VIFHRGAAHSFQMLIREYVLRQLVVVFVVLRSSGSVSLRRVSRHLGMDVSPKNPLSTREAHDLASCLL
jgi:hypothetical protein